LTIIDLIDLKNFLTEFTLLFSGFFKTVADPIIDFPYFHYWYGTKFIAQSGVAEKLFNRIYAAS